ncbi:MAG: hypothetical protein ACYS8I_13725 [Planctomycetota bacterium]|jgi:hypothetical protein
MTVKAILTVCIAVALIFFFISAFQMAQVNRELRYIAFASAIVLAAGLVALAIHEKK